MMFNFSIFSISLLLATLAATESPRAPNEELPEVTAKRLEQIARAMNDAAVLRGFRLRVIDQLDRPIAGIWVNTSTTNLNDRPAGAASPYVIAKANYLSNADGDVIIAPSKMYNFNAWVDPQRVPAAVAIPDENKATFSFDATDAHSPSVDAKRLGVDAVLCLYRNTHPPHPVFAVYAPERKGISADGTPFAWSPLHGKSFADLAAADFEVTVTRDPSAPLVLRGRLLPEEPEENLPNFSADWKVAIRCLRGGVVPVAQKEVAFTAPEAGYRNTHEWNFRVADQPNHYQRVRFFWRRTGNPVRYGFVEISCRLLITEFNTAPKVFAAITSWAYMNPAADDRLIERSFQERYDPTSEDTPPWITALTPEMVEQWNLEPVDGGAIPLAP